jgi:hypothetical protein
MKKLSILMLVTVIALSLIGPVFSASTGVQIEFLMNQLRYASGSLAGGKVYFYESGGDTAKAVYLDINKVTQAANPYTLDANGTAMLYGDGTYRIVIKTAALVTIYDRDPVKIEDLSTGLYSSAYDQTIRPQNVTGNGTGRVQSFSFGTVAGTDDAVFDRVTTTTGITQTDNITTANITTANITMANITNIVVDNWVLTNFSITDNTLVFVDNSITATSLTDNTITSAKLRTITPAPDNLAYYRYDGAWVSAALPGYVSLTKTDNQATVANTENAFTWDVEVSDDLDAHSGSNSYVVVPAGYTLARVDALWNSIAAGNVLHFMKVRTDSTYLGSAVGLFVTGNMAPLNVNTGWFPVVEGDHIYVIGFSTSTTPLIIGNTTTTASPSYLKVEFR